MKYQLFDMLFQERYTSLINSAIPELQKQLLTIDFYACEGQNTTRVHVRSGIISL